MAAGRFWPRKQQQGLSKRQKTRRAKEIAKQEQQHWKDPRAQAGFKTDKGVKGKPSNYTRKWKQMFPEATSLEEKAKATGVPLKEIQESQNRGLAAWRTGHRPGATEQQWGQARVHSFLLCGKTQHTTDSDLARNATRRSKKAAAWWKKTCRKGGV